MGFVYIANINLDSFLTDLSGINVFLGPLIVSLAIPIAQKKDLIKKYLFPITIGSFIGALTSVLSVLILGKVFNLNEDIIISIIPKSASTPIAIEITNRLGGIRAITVAVVVISAVLGAMIIPILVKMFKIKNPLIIGMGLGVSSHAIGTAKALEIDSTAGAISGIALVISGIFTVLITLFL
jgi:putative effector of murein hydrolase